jgi:hypothetical protein
VLFRDEGAGLRYRSALPTRNDLTRRGESTDAIRRRRQVAKRRHGDHRTIHFDAASSFAEKFGDTAHVAPLRRPAISEAVRFVDGVRVRNWGYPRPRI